MFDLGMKRMSLPVRAETCDHVTCFDAHTFFDQFSTCINHPKPSCPVCGKMIQFDTIRIDDFFVQALAK